MYILDTRTVKLTSLCNILQEVRIGYRGKRRCIGTFATRDNAAAANEVARKLLDQTIVSKLSEEEAKENVLSAKEAAKQAVDVAQTSSRPNIDIWAHEGDCDGPRLRRGRLQDEKVRSIEPRVHHSTTSETHWLSRNVEIYTVAR